MSEHLEESDQGPYSDHCTEEELTRKEERNLRIAMEMPDDDPHGLHSRARAAMKLEDWPLAYDSARSLLQLDSSPYKVVEGCVMLGIAAAKLGRFEDLDEAIRRANDLAPGNPDVRYLELVRVAHSYLDSIGEGEESGTQEYLRPHILWHIRERADTILAMLVGRPDDEPGLAGRRLAAGHS